MRSSAISKLHRLVPAAEMDKHCADLAVTFVKLVSRDKAKALLTYASSLWCDTWCYMHACFNRQVETILAADAADDISAVAQAGLQSVCQALLTAIVTQLDDVRWLRTGALATLVTVCQYFPALVTGCQHS